MPDELPDDLSLWPGDPFDLLSIARDAPERDARRAYIRLIKRFKPEHHPDHFQKIREAFEHVQKQIEFRARYQHLYQNDGNDEDAEPETDSPAEEGPSKEAKDGSPPAADAVATSDAEPFERMPAAEVLAHGSYSLPRGPVAAPRQGELPQANRAADLWHLALTGDTAGAYAGLVQLVNERRTAGALAGDAGQVFAKLYWLLTMEPHLDPGRTPCEWLTQGLAQTKLIGPLSELYRREIASNPLEALTPRCEALLDGDSLPRALVELLGWRWQAAAAVNSGDIILADLGRVRQRLVFDDESAWGQLLLSAIELLVWLKPGKGPALDPAVQSILAELEQLSHLHAELGDGYDRLDLLLDVARGWFRIAGADEIPSSWAELVPLFYLRPFEELRPKLLEVLRSMTTYPLRALRTMDAIRERSAAAAAQFGMLINRFRIEEGGERPDEERPWPAALRLAEAFFRQKRPGPYHLWRAKLLEFCLAEGIEPTVLAAAMDELAEKAGTAGENLQDEVRGDGPLRHVYDGAVAFWG